MSLDARIVLLYLACAVLGAMAVGRALRLIAAESDEPDDIDPGWG